MGLLDDVRESCRQIAEAARSVSIDLDAASPLEDAQPPALDPVRRYLGFEPA